MAKIPVLLLFGLSLSSSILLVLLYVREGEGVANFRGTISSVFARPPAPAAPAAAASGMSLANGSTTVDLAWYAPSSTDINNLTNVVSVGTSGVYGFIYNSSTTPDDEYGAYNWCNMPHVRAKEYVVPSEEYELVYVELVSPPSCRRLRKENTVLTMRRFIAITSALLMRPTPSPQSRILGTATTRACTFLPGPFPTAPPPRQTRVAIRRLWPTGKGPATSPASRTPSRPLRPGGRARASSRRLPPPGWTTRGSTAQTSMASTATSSGSCPPAATRRRRGGRRSSIA